MIDSAISVAPSRVRTSAYRSVVLLAALVCLPLFLLGCGASDDPTYRVHGTVTYQSQPVDGGIISFFPADGGPPLGGPFDEQGEYEFRLPAGDYRVIVNAPAHVPEGWQEGDPLPNMRPRVPPRYAHPRNSRLTAQIAAQSEPQQIDFNLK